MSKLLKVLYEVAEIRCRYHRIHETVFGFSPRRLLRTLHRNSPTDERAADERELERILERLHASREDLAALSAEDISIRRGREIQASLAAYVDALAESGEKLRELCVLQQPTDAHEDAEYHNALNTLKVAYDDAVQYHKRLARHLNELIATL
jgi:hypothetical protein